jgi:hypothetical protein
VAMARLVPWVTVNVPGTELGWMGADPPGIGATTPAP